MPSIHGTLKNAQPLVRVLIASDDPAFGHVQHEYVGLIDTGCTNTCVTRTVVEQLGLESFTRMLVATPSGLERRRAYAFTLGFFDEGDRTVGAPRAPYIFDGSLAGADFVKNSDFDVLIGMDVIARGRLVFDQQRFEFSF